MKELDGAVAGCNPAPRLTVSNMVARTSSPSRERTESPCYISLRSKFAFVYHALGGLFGYVSSEVVAVVQFLPQLFQVLVAETGFAVHEFSQLVRSWQSSLEFEVFVRHSLFAGISKREVKHQNSIRKRVARSVCRTISFACYSSGLFIHGS